MPSPFLGETPTSTALITEKLNLKTRLAYGFGELAGALPTSASAFLLLYFLTRVAGLNPTLAGGAMLFGKVWDAFSDPIVGWLSDRTRSPLGRRYPWMLGAAIPLGVCCILQWVTPPTSNQWVLFAYYSTVSVLAYAAFSSVMVPFSALAAELTQGYNERITLISFKSTFSIGGSIFALLVAQVIFAHVANPQRAYVFLGVIIGLLVIVAVGLCVLGTYRQYRTIRIQHPQITVTTSQSLLNQIRIATSNRPFRHVIGLYLFSWTGVQISAVILPYFVVDWMGLPEPHFIRMALAVQGTAVASMFIWNWIGRKTGKRAIYFMGVPLAIGGQLGLFLLQPGQIVLMYTLAMVAGLGIATVYLVPWSMLPDVVDFDELTTGQRREGIFYGFVVFLQKIGIALAIFLTGKILDWAGLITTSGGETLAIQQPDSALWAIRLIMGFLPIVSLLGGLIFAYHYPITREVHAEILLKLKQRLGGRV